MSKLIPVVALLTTAAAEPAASRDTGPAAARIQAEMDRRMPTIVREEHIGGIGIAVIRNGRIVWTGHYGNQSPGVPITNSTAFNTASIAKTVTAETLLALAEARRIDLDESIATLVRSPGLDTDPRYRKLTTRILLSHRSGLRNWPDDYPDGKLAFESEPGKRYGYSGAGIELAARYAEAKTGKRQRQLAAETLLRPWRINQMAIGELPAWTTDRLALPVDAQGKYLDVATVYPGLRQGSGIGAAYDLIATTSAYGAFLERLIAASRRPTPSRAARETILTPLAGDERYGCVSFAIRADAPTATATPLDGRCIAMASTRSYNTPATMKGRPTSSTFRQIVAPALRFSSTVPMARPQLSGRWRSSVTNPR